MRITHLDHLVLTVREIDATVRFYTGILGMRRETFGEGRVALCFGTQKINLHRAGHEFDPKAARPAPGSADLCLIVDTPLGEAMDEVRRYGVAIESGPAPRTGAQGAMTSFYLRDPDENLIEIASYAPAG